MARHALTDCQHAGCPQPMANAKRHPQMCDWAAQRSLSAASFLQTVERERVMGVNTDYLGHVEIVPNLCTSEDQR